MLKFWQHFAELSPREVEAILRRFPQLDTGWGSGTMGTDGEGADMNSKQYQCPKWCTEGHSADDERHAHEVAGLRHHSRVVGQVPAATVTVDQAQNLDDGEWSPPLVNVLGPSDSLTPGAARRLAQLLLDAADIAEN